VFLWSMPDLVLSFFSVINVQARIKNIMQVDEDVGKIAVAVLVLVCGYGQHFQFLFLSFWAMFHPFIVLDMLQIVFELNCFCKI